EERGAPLLVHREGLAGGVAHPLVEAALSAGEKPLVRVDGFAHIHRDARHFVLVLVALQVVELGAVARHAVTIESLLDAVRSVLELLATGGLAGHRREARGIVERNRYLPEDRLVLGSVPKEDLLGGIEPRAVHLDAVFARADRLVVGGVATP